MTGGVQPFCALTPSDEDEVVMEETITFLMTDAGEAGFWAGERIENV